VYPPSKLAQATATITGGIWFAGLGLLFAGDKILPMIGVQEESVAYKFIMQNKISVGVGLFILNSIGNGMLSTGAFEVYYNGNLIFSKLKTGRVPQGEDIVEILEAEGLGPSLFKRG
jgi:thioredoxin reductase-like selenoprotein T